MKSYYLYCGGTIINVFFFNSRLRIPNEIFSICFLNFSPLIVIHCAYLLLIWGFLISSITCKRVITACFKYQALSELLPHPYQISSSLGPLIWFCWEPSSLQWSLVLILQYCPVSLNSILFSWSCPHSHDYAVFFSQPPACLSNPLQSLAPLLD